MKDVKEKDWSDMTPREKAIATIEMLRSISIHTDAYALKKIQEVWDAEVETSEGMVENEFDLWNRLLCASRNYTQALSELKKNFGLYYTGD